jgi:acyl-CoA synthetase (AMP-forming)/AMP-acid ligase II
MAFTGAHPDAAESTLSLSGLREDWLSVADYLRDVGIGAGDVLVVNPENYPRYLSLILGGWEAEAAAVLVGPWLPEADLDALLHLTGERLGRPVFVGAADHGTTDSIVADRAGTLTYHPR